VLIFVSSTCAGPVRSWIGHPFPPTTSFKKISERSVHLAPYRVERRKWNPRPPSWAPFSRKEYIWSIMAAPMAGVTIRSSLLFRALCASSCVRDRTDASSLWLTDWGDRVWGREWDGTSIGDISRPSPSSAFGRCSRSLVVIRFFSRNNATVMSGPGDSELSYKPPLIQTQNGL